MPFDLLGHTVTPLQKYLMFKIMVESPNIANVPHGVQIRECDFCMVSNGFESTIHGGRFCRSYPPFTKFPTQWY